MLIDYSKWEWAYIWFNYIMKNKWNTLKFENEFKHRFILLWIRSNLITAILMMKLKCWMTLFESLIMINLWIERLLIEWRFLKLIIFEEIFRMELCICLISCPIYKRQHKLQQSCGPHNCRALIRKLGNRAYGPQTVPNITKRSINHSINHHRIQRIKGNLG